MNGIYQPKLNTDSVSAYLMGGKWLLIIWKFRFFNKYLQPVLCLLKSQNSIFNIIYTWDLYWLYLILKDICKSRFICRWPLMFRYLKFPFSFWKWQKNPGESRTQQCWPCPGDVSEAIKGVELKAQAFSTILLVRGTFCKLFLDKGPVWLFMCWYCWCIFFTEQQGT